MQLYEHKQSLQIAGSKNLTGIAPRAAGEVAVTLMWCTAKWRRFKRGNAGAGLDFCHGRKRADRQRGTITSEYPAAETAINSQLYIAPTAWCNEA